MSKDTPAVFRFVALDDTTEDKIPTEEEREARNAMIEEFISQFPDMPPMNKKKRRTLIEMSAPRFESYKVGVVIAHCCRVMDLARAYHVYVDAKERSLVIHNDVYSMLLSLVSGLGDQGSSLAPPRTMDPPSDAAAARAIYTDIRQNNVPMSESMYTAVIRCFSTSGAEKEALALYKEMTSPFSDEELIIYRAKTESEDIQEKFMRPFLPKLRTYCPLLASFSAVGDVETCMWIYQDMTERYKITPMERDYVSLFKVFITVRDRARFHAVLRAFMEDFLVPQQSTWTVLREWFETCESGEGNTAYVTAVSSNSRSGRLQSNGHFLQSIDLDDNTREVLLRQIDAIASQRHETIVQATAQTRAKSTVGGEQGVIVMGGGKGQLTPKMLERTLKNAKETASKWEAFKVWQEEIVSKGLDTYKEFGVSEASDRRSHIKHLAQKPRYSYCYDVIIDGANCGYYKTNYVGAPSHVDYHQIDWMVRHLQGAGFKPLLMLHCRHLMHNTVPSDCVHLVQSWRRENLIYETPAKCNDDWFWLYLAVKLQCKVVTNDEMRDHHFQMLSPRSFARWKERHQIRFNFDVWLKRGQESVSALANSSSDSDEAENVHRNCADASHVTKLSGTISNGAYYRKTRLEIPRTYSHRMQCLINEASYAFPCEENTQWLCCYRKNTAIAWTDDSGISTLPRGGLKRKGDIGSEINLVSSAGEKSTASLGHPLKRQLTKM